MTMQQMSVQANKPGACSYYRLSLWGSYAFRNLFRFTNLGDLFSHQPQLFSSYLRAFHFLYVILPFFLFSSDLIICFSLAYSYQRPPGTPESLDNQGVRSEDYHLCRHRFGTHIWELAELRVVGTDHQLAQHWC